MHESSQSDCRLVDRKHTLRPRNDIAGPGGCVFGGVRLWGVCRGLHMGSTWAPGAPTMLAHPGDDASQTTTRGCTLSLSLFPAREGGWTSNHNAFRYHDCPCTTTTTGERPWRSSPTRARRERRALQQGPGLIEGLSPGSPLDFAAIVGIGSRFVTKAASRVVNSIARTAAPHMPRSEGFCASTARTCVSWIISSRSTGLIRNFGTA